MATHYVNSGASGSNNGTSWADAWTSITSAISGAAAGDTVKVHWQHSESIGTATYAWAGTATAPVMVVSVDKDDSDAYRAGATLTHSSNSITTLNGGVIVVGFTWNFIFLSLAATPGAVQIYEACNFAAVASGTTRRMVVGNTAGTTVVRQRVRFVRCSFDADTNGNANSDIQVGLVALEFVDSTIRVNSASSSIFTFNIRPGTVALDGCDLSASTETVLATFAGLGSSLVASRCRLPAGYTAAAGTIGLVDRLELERCAAGTIAAPPLGLTRHQDAFGVVASTLARYRDGGADDGAQANPHAWELTTAAAALEVFRPLRTPPIARWVEGGASVTFTVRVASGVTLTDAEFWVELSGPDDSSPASTEGYNASTRAAPGATPAALATDSTSTWNGTGVGTKQEASITYTPQVSGPVLIRACLARPSATVYLDPIVDVDGDAADAGPSRYASGIQWTAEAAGEGGGGGGAVLIGSTFGHIREY